MPAASPLGFFKAWLPCLPPWGPQQRSPEQPGQQDQAGAVLVPETPRVPEGPRGKNSQGRSFLASWVYPTASLLCVPLSPRLCPVPLGPMVRRRWGNSSVLSHVTRASNVNNPLRIPGSLVFPQFSSQLFLQTQGSPVSKMTLLPCSVHPLAPRSFGSLEEASPFLTGP